MLQRISTLLEMANIIGLLHIFFDKKNYINPYSIILVISDLIIFELINMYGVDRIIVLILYFLVFGYTMVNFKVGIRQLLLANILYVIILGIMQAAVGMTLLLFGIDEIEGDILAFIINSVTLCLISFLHTTMYRFYHAITKKRWNGLFIIIAYFVYVVSNIISYKIFEELSIYQLVTIVLFGFMFCILIYYWQNEREKVYRKDLELQMSQLYGESFNELIEIIQEKQHDFNNHIQAIKSQHYTINTYEELVAAQSEYCAKVTNDNKYYKLLNANEPILSGFLYGKCKEADTKDIRIVYEVTADGSDANIPIHILIEIIGILWDNAIEFLDDFDKKDDKEINIVFNKSIGRWQLQISNPIGNISYSEIETYFSKGYSQKENHLGIGLSKITK